MFTLEELTSYLPDAAANPQRAALLRDLTLALVYETIPAATADASPTAKVVGLEVAARAFRNVDGYTSETVDDYTYRRDSSTGAAGVYLTGSERSSLLALVTGGPTGGVRSVRMRSWSQL